MNSKNTKGVAAFVFICWSLFLAITHQTVEPGNPWVAVFNVMYGCALLGLLSQAFVLERRDRKAWLAKLRASEQAASKASIEASKADEVPQARVERASQMQRARTAVRRYNSEHKARELAQATLKTEQEYEKTRLDRDWQKVLKCREAEMNFICGVEDN